MPPVAKMLTIADALPSGKASEYVAAAYLVFLLLLVVYLAIMAVKVQRIERNLSELADFAEAREEASPVRGNENDEAEREEVSA